MQCCAAVQAAYRKQETPQLQMEGMGEGCGLFCLNNFVADCSFLSSTTFPVLFRHYLIHLRWLKAT